MSQYATIADLYTFGAPEAAFSGLSAGDLNAGLVAASSTADSYFRSRYALPLTTWGTDVTRAVAIVATYDLLTARGYNPMGTDGNLESRYQAQIGWLKDVGKQAAQADVTPSEIDAGYPEPNIVTRPRRW